MTASTHETRSEAPGMEPGRLRSDPLAALATPPPAPDGEREGMKRQEWPEPCCYLNHELEQPCGLPPAEVVFTQTMTGPPTPAAADRPEPHPCFCQHGYGCDSYGRREPVSPDPTPAAAVSVSALVEALVSALANERDALMNELVQHVGIGWVSDAVARRTGTMLRLPDTILEVFGEPHHIEYQHKFEAKKRGRKA